MIELALPAGSLQSALVAFEHGADAVYLGLQQFSARKGATNFSFEDIGRLKAYISGQQKFYVAINTLITDEELPEVESTLRKLAMYHPDGVIVQDLGIAKLINDHYKEQLPLHGSTQLAVHSVSGVRMMAKLGFTRVVLSRELTLSEITAIRAECPDIELKVFIHGALCYGFSGLCMASDVLVGRSANRGECAQVCRTWFTRSDEGTSGFYFSMRDLDIAHEVKELQRIGIDSLKIEGRMKSPAYVKAVTRYYRYLIDGASEELIEQARKEAHIIFSRDSAEGWLSSYRKDSKENREGPRLSTVAYPGHTGIGAGTIQTVKNTNEGTIAKVIVEHPIALHDGLLVRIPSSFGIDTPYKFGVKHLYASNGKPIISSKGLSTVFINIPKEVPVTPHTTLFMISKHNQDLAFKSEQSIKPYKMPIDIECSIESDAIVLSTSTFFADSIQKRFPITIEIAEKPQKTVDNITRIFAASDQSYLTLGRLSLRNISDLMFLPLSILKEIRREWYAYLDELFDRWCNAASTKECASNPPMVGELLPQRDLIIPRGEKGYIWVDPIRVVKALKQGKEISDFIPKVENTWYIPLAPITFDEPIFFTSLDTLINLITQKYKNHNIRVGLNNIAHIEWAQTRQEILCFADVYLYASNSMAVKQLYMQLPNLVGLYQWVESPATTLQNSPIIPSPVGNHFTMPLFISRSCFRYDSVGLTCENCPKRGSWEIEQQNKRFLVEVRDCMTVVSLLK